MSLLPDDAALYVYGVTRSRGWLAGRGEQEDIVRVRYRDLEAVTRASGFEMPALDDEHVQRHQSTIDQIMRRSTVLPLPFGLVFRSRRAVIQFLQDQYIVLDEALAFI